MALAPGAAAMLWRYRNLLIWANVWAVALIPMGILVVCFVDAGLRRVFGTKVADNILKAVLGAGLVFGLIMLTRYLDSR